jgi:hypothetical protein
MKKSMMMAYLGVLIIFTAICGMISDMYGLAFGVIIFLAIAVVILGSAPDEEEWTEEDQRAFLNDVYQPKN